MLRRARSPEVGYALLSAGASGVLAAFVLRLWNASLGVPFAPNGDGYLVLMQVKGLLDNGWVLTNPHLGAPFGQDLRDYAANRELLHVVTVKLLGLFSSNPAAVVNVYFLLSFPLVGLTAYIVMRWVGLSRGSAMAMSVIYALAPFHFRHQTFLWAYYTVPLAAYLILSIYSGAPLFERRAGQASRLLRYASRRSLVTLGLAALVAISGIYYAAFTVILVMIAAAITFAVSRSRAPLAAGVAIAVAIVATGALAQSPDLIYRAQHGTNPVVGKRGAGETQLYSTNILQLVMPVQGHRLPPLRRLHDRWRTDTRVDGEATQLGLIAAVGFGWLLVVAVLACAGAAGRFVASQRHLAAANVTALLLGTLGGLSGLIAYLVSPQLRSWTRLSIFIAFFALAAVGLLLDAAMQELRRRGVGVPRLAVAAALAVICAVAVLDQTSSSVVPAYDANAATYRADDSFASRIERTLGPDASVLQLPYVPFPENPSVGGTGPYDQVRPYLHTQDLSWSFGAMRARPADWQAESAGAPPETLVPMVAAAGFDGIYLDRAAYPDLAGELARELERVLEVTPLLSADNRFAFFDVRPYGRRLRARLAPGELRELADATLRPVRADWGGDFSQRQQEGADSSRWSVVPDAAVTVINPSDRERSATLFVKLTRSGGDSAPVSVTYPDQTSERVQVAPDGSEVERTLTFPPGESTIRLATDGSAIPAPAGVPTGYVQLLGWRITPPVP